MVWPGAREWLFSAKAFAAAMLAFWIACALDLPRPVWSIFTVYILMQPISGAVRAKAVFRMIGTVAGAAIALLLMAWLADLPAALFLSLGLVTIVGFFLSMLDRMPRGYTYLMAGITASVIGLPDTLDPLSGFATATARIEEVLLGIICVVVVDSIVFPHPAGAVLNARVADWLKEAQDYMLRALVLADDAGAPRPADAHAAPHAALAKLATDAAQLDALASHVGYDSVPHRPNRRTVRLLHTRMLLLIRQMFAASDWIAALRPGRAGIDLAGIERAGIEPVARARSFRCATGWARCPPHRRRRMRRCWPPSTRCGSRRPPACPPTRAPIRSPSCAAPWGWSCAT